MWAMLLRLNSSWLLVGVLLAEHSVTPRLRVSQVPASYEAARVPC